MALPAKMTQAQYLKIESELRFFEKLKRFEVSNSLLNEEGRYIPHSGQLAIHGSNAQHVVAICGRRFGKSKMASKEAENVLMKPNKLVWIVAPHYKLTDKVFRELIAFYVNERKCQDIKKGRSGLPRYSENERYLELVNGSIAVCNTADNKNSLVGDGIDYLIFDECAKSTRSIWEKYLSPTLADKKREGRALFITTPEGKNWVYDLFRMGQSDEFPDWESFHFPSRINPHIKPGYIEGKKKELTDENFRQEYLAEFTTFAGRVYKDFDVGTHVTAKMPTSFDRWLVGIDYGFINPTAILIIGKLDGRYYVLDEVYQKGLSERDTVRAMEGLRKQYPQIKRGFADTSELSFTKEINRAGFSIRNAKKDVADGIQLVAEKMKIKDDGVPGLLVHPRCKNTIRELEIHRYAEQRGESNIKEQPLKENDHAPDALRYAIYSDEKVFKAMSMKGDSIFG
jgi:PBSX family phage terminase large subunit